MFYQNYIADFYVHNFFFARHHVHGIHVHNKNGVDANLAKMYFADANPSWDVYTADVKAYVLEQNCNALIENPDMEQKDLFWTYTDRDRSKVKVIAGAGGSGHALRVYDRDHSWRGIRQVLDPRCFVAAEEFTIYAKFRLVDDSLAGVTCDPSYLVNSLDGAQCPSVVIYGRKCASGDVYQQFWNGLVSTSICVRFSSLITVRITQWLVSYSPLLQDAAWNPEGWNNYETSFAVTEELAACESVEVWIHQINRSWNIEVDDVQIYASA